MARPCDFLMTLALMSYWSTYSLGCDLTQTGGFMNKTLLELLVQKKRSFPVSCLKDRKNFLCPLEEMYAQQIQKPQVIQVLHAVTEQTLILFASNELSAARETTLLDTFSSGLCRQLKNLQTCLMQQVGVQEPPLSQEDSLVAVRKYFHRITAYLREKKHSPCAWKVVRVEVWRAWSFSANLLERLTKEEKSRGVSWDQTLDLTV